MTDPSFSPAANPDVQEALSRRYGAAALVVVPLSSGNFGLFDRSNILLRVLDREDLTPENLEFSSHEGALRLSVAAAANFYGEPSDRALARDLREQHREPRAPRTPRVPNINLGEDL